MGCGRRGETRERERVKKKDFKREDSKNLFVTDGSFMTSSSCVNPSLTYMAFTARACDYAVAQLQEGRLG